MIVSVRFSSVSPTSLASSISFSSERRVRNSRRASAAFSPLDTSARRSSRPASRSSDCKRSTVPRILSISRFFSNGLKINAANFQGNGDTRPRHFPLRAHVLLLLRLGCLVELYRLFERQVVKFRDLFDVFQRLLGFVGDLLFGQLFVVKLDNLLD